MRTGRNKAFTLAEVLVATTISVFVALVAAGALKSVSDSAERVDRVERQTSEVRFATRMIARDLDNLYRDRNGRNMRLVGAGQVSDEAETAYLKFWAVGRANARDGQPEGDVYEIEYILGQNASLDDLSEMEPTRSILFRRLWPNPDPNRQPGGVLTPIAESIDLFQIRFFDGQQWTSDWPEEMQSIPELVEVSLVSVSPESQEPTVGTLMMSFPRMAAETPPLGGSPGQPGRDNAGQPRGQNAGPPGNGTRGPGEGNPSVRR